MSEELSPLHKLILLSDPHLCGAGALVAGRDPLPRLEAALAHACDRHADARALILMGDLTDTGAAEEYRRLRAALHGLPFPCHFMLGNHDRREAFRATFPEAPVTGEGHVQSVIDLDRHRLILLDTLDAPPYRDGHHAGRLCPVRRAWLGGALATAGNRRPVVFTHHPAAPIGIPWLDGIALAEPDELLATLAAHGAHLVSGHVHRTASGFRRGVSWTTVASTSHRNALDIGRSAPSPRPDAPGGYGVLLLAGEDIVLHAVDVPLPDPG